MEETNQDNRFLYLDVLFGNWMYINDTTIQTAHQIACDLNHPNIKRIFDRAIEDVKKSQLIVNEAFKDLGIEIKGVGINENNSVS